MFLWVTGVTCSHSVLLVHTFFYHNNELPEIYREYFVINSTVHSHSTRQKSDLHICSVQKSVGQKSIQYVGSVLWNEIPHLLKNPMSRYTFKRKLKAHFVEWTSCILKYVPCLLRSTPYIICKLSCCTSYFSLAVALFLLLFFVLFHIFHMHVIILL